MRATLLGSAIAVTMALPAVADETIKLGLIEPYSGPIAAIGTDTLDAYKYQIDVVNEGGGVLGGRKLEVVGYDNAMNAEKTTQQLRKLIDDGIRYVSQGVGSNHALNIIKQLGKHNKRNPDQSVLFLNHSAVTTAFTNELCSFWHFRFDANVDMKVAALASWMGSDDKVTKVYLVNQNYAYGKSFQAAANRLVKERVPNAEIVGDELIVPFGKIQDFTPYIAKIQAAGADTVLTGNWGPDVQRLIKQSAEAGLKVQWYTIYAGVSSSLAALGKEAGTFMPVKQVTEYHENDPVNPPSVVKNANGYKERYKITAYNDRFRFLIQMWAKAIDKAGSADPVAVGRALEGMTFLGAGGEIYMRAADHQIIFPMVISTISADVKQNFIYKGKDMGMAFNTDGWVQRRFLDLPTTCKMKRPS
jgi:branched-chain amino acid transport system substrate-binding protein